MNKLSLHQIVALIIFALISLEVNAEAKIMGIGNDLLGLETPENNAKDPINSEVLVFVDVSGSMKQNDPLNMRSPAIRLLSGMAPASAKVGIYLFGTSVRELVPFESVSDQWKQKAENFSHRYQSRDLYTNIESALVSAESKWSKNTNRQRSIILLTDGIVDIDKNSLVSIASRDRILDRVIKSLQEQQVNVHTIALSENADHRLLKELAVSTEGHYQQVDSAELLQRTFMSLFEQSAPQDTVPLEGNQVNVDNSISELTLLVFRKAEAKPTQLKSPKGTVYDQSSSHKELKWKHDTGYDLISIKNPVAGTWHLIADEDPDNRAMIVTDLKLQTSNLPSVVLNGEEIGFEMWMEDKGNKITRTDFLNLINTEVITTLNSGEQVIKPLDTPSSDGLIKYSHGPDWHIGEQELLIRVKTDTFIREKRFPMTAYSSPIEVRWDELSPVDDSESTEVDNQHDDLTSGWSVVINTIPELIDIEQSSLTVEIINQQNNKQDVEVVSGEQGWQFQYIPTEPGQSTVSITLSTLSPSGREIVIEHPNIKLGELIEVVEPPAQTEHIIEETKLPTLMQIVIPVAVGNVIYLMLFLAWRWFKKMREASYLNPEEVL